MRVAINKSVMCWPHFRRLYVQRFLAKWFQPSRFLTHLKNESSKTSQPSLVGALPAVSNVPFSHMSLSVRRESGGTMIRCLRMSRSISAMRSFGRLMRRDKSNECCVVFICVLCKLLDLIGRFLRKNAGRHNPRQARPESCAKCRTLCHSGKHLSKPESWCINFPLLELACSRSDEM